MEQNREFRNSPTHIFSTNLTKVQRQFNGERIVFSTNGGETIRYPHAKKEQTTTHITFYIKINSMWIVDLNVKPKTMKLVEENTGKKSFFDMA